MNTPPACGENASAGAPSRAFASAMWVEPFASAPNADLVVVLIMGTLTLLLALLPFIPGLRTIPKWIPLHRVIWREYYRAAGAAAPPARPAETEDSPAVAEHSLTGG